MGEYSYKDSKSGNGSRNSLKNSLGSRQKESLENSGNQKEKTKISVALEYVPGEDAPKIIATGKGSLAEKIIEKAKESDVPVYEDSKLANTLSKLEIGDMIPPELYSVVAEILVFVDECDRIRGKVNSKKVRKL